MAYRNLVNVSCASIGEVFRHVKDFIASRNGIADYSSGGLGWTLHDSSFAVDADNVTVDDWVVFTSPGESGDHALTYRILYSSLANSILRTASGLSWNASTNAWEQRFPASDISGGPTTGTTFSLWVYGDLDGFSVIIGNGSTLYGRYFGLLADTMLDDTVAKSTGAVSSGSNVVVTVDSVPAAWAVGLKLYIWDGSNIKQATIGSISGENVTLATLATGFASGARLALDYSVIISDGLQFISTGYLQIGRGGSLSDTLRKGATQYNSTLLGYAAPDTGNSRHLTEFARVSWTTIGYYGRYRNILIVSSTGIISGNIYVDEDGVNWRALSINSIMTLFKEV